MTNKSLVVTFVFIIPLLALGIQRLLFAGLEAPPSDYGSGSMFDAIASRYDLINRVLAVGMDLAWRQRMVQAIRESVTGVEQPKILDLATGTADVALLLAKELPNAQITGIDPSHNMLAVGRQKVQAALLSSRISLEWADAQDLTRIDPQSFDAATMAFGIRNVPDRSKALCQIHRVLKDQARFCILEFSEPDDSFGVLGIAARMFIRYVVPLTGAVLSGAPREYWHLQHSIQDFPAPPEFSRSMEQLQCPTGTFRRDALVHMNFGSVQLYVMRAVRNTKQS